VTKFAFVSAEPGNHAVATLCRIVGVSVSGFYAWLHAIPVIQSRAEVDVDLCNHIGRIFNARRRVYGSPRIHAELRQEGRRHGRRRIERLMREMASLPARGAAGRRARPTAATTCQSRRTGWSETSLLNDPTRGGWRISPTFRPTRGGSISLRSRIWRHARSSAGRWPVT
jgi:hypothetical protein